MAVGDIIVITGSIVQPVALESIDSGHKSIPISIRQNDGTVVDIDNLYLDAAVRAELLVESVALYCFKHYAPANLHFLLASKHDDNTRLFEPISLFYLFGLVVAIIAANLITIPAGKVIMEHFFVSTLSRLVLICAYIGAMGYAVYTLVHITSLYMASRRVRQVVESG